MQDVYPLARHVADYARDSDERTIFGQRVLPPGWGTYFNAQLNPNVVIRHGLSREEALALIEQLQAAQRQIVALERDVHAAVVRHPPVDPKRPA